MIIIMIIIIKKEYAFRARPTEGRAGPSKIYLTFSSKSADLIINVLTVCFSKQKTTFLGNLRPAHKVLKEHSTLEFQELIHYIRDC